MFILRTWRESESYRNAETLRLSEEFEKVCFGWKEIGSRTKFRTNSRSPGGQVISSYFPCKTSIHRIASESLTFPR
jgi:hypothetical protein